MTGHLVSAAQGSDFLLAIPRGLLDLLETHVSPAPWTPDAWKREKSLAERCGANPAAVGFWGRNPLLNHDLLPPPPLPVVSQADAQEMGWEMNQAQLDNQRRIGEIRLEYFNGVARGYAGWLVTNPSFQAEQVNLIRDWAGEIRRLGLSGIGRLLSASGTADLQVVQQDLHDREQQFHRAVRQFLVRWRLDELTAPNLPAPVKPVMAGAFPISVANHLMDMGGLFHIPDTFPIPSRDELRGMLDDALHRSDENPHLDEWTAIVRANNPAKNQIDRFGRIRQVHHYWALLHARHGEIAGRADQLQRAFAEHLKVSVDSIQRDLDRIASRLGSGWVSSASFHVPTPR